MVQQELPEVPVILVQQVVQVLLDQLERMVQPDPQVLQVKQVQQVPQVLRGRQVNKGPQAQPE